MKLFQTKNALLSVLVLSMMLIPTLRAETVDGEQASLYDRLGGLAPITVVVSDFLDELVPDPLLNQNPAIDAARQAVPKPYLKYQVTAMVCQATGGPCEYHGRNMKAAHAHLNITEREWARMVVIFKDLLARHQVPEQETNELLAIIDSTKSDIVMASSP
ncbi:group 1 truncated hemoglobin [Methylophaga sp.]|uniref:group I truncated hemoglobin n=1 Tax=Methylophaga sp. TaxID=2024840 RepID=UPI0014000172|nr:group 1 truncated hemoglobin [Methylophaga sp.]MTI62681.1 group 1 truncated hemoglobin [Methylophaga sp.]